jgi:hypothetical protein
MRWDTTLRAVVHVSVDATAPARRKPPRCGSRGSGCRATNGCLKERKSAGYGWYVCAERAGRCTVEVEREVGYRACRPAVTGVLRRDRGGVLICRLERGGVPDPA